MMKKSITAALIMMGLCVKGIINLKCLALKSLGFCHDKRVFQWRKPRTLNTSGREEFSER